MITIEPARFAMTGAACGVFSSIRMDADFDQVQALDAPEFIARGSLLAGHTTVDGAQYVCSTDLRPSQY